ncbi:MAG: DUF58 domain-containing protein [Oscillospiraceae bacterium]|nr:DUF58 domain-containing protein [Oscillospiraceae bacterium]
MELIAMALILTAVLIAQYLVYKNLGLRGIDYKLTISKAEAFEGEEIEVIEEITNAKRLPLPWVRSEICCSRWLAFYGDAQNVAKDAQKGFVAGIFMLKGNQKLRRVWRVKCEKRGVFTIEDITLSVSDLFGLVKTSCMIKVKEQICVLPSPSEPQLPTLSSDSFIGNNTVRRFILPDPFLISGAREYTGREPMNRIHWAQTAKTGTPMVYNNEFSTERKVLVAFNLQRMVSDEKQRLPISVLEAQIKAAAFVLDYCYRSHIEAAFAANSEQVIFVPAEQGYEHMLNILRALARIKNRCGAHMDEYFWQLDYSEYTDVILISNIMSDKMAQVMQELASEGKYVALMSNETEHTGFCDVYRVPRTRSYPMESGDDE